MKVKKITAIISAIIIFLVSYVMTLSFELFSVSAEEGVPDGYTPIHNINELNDIRNNLNGKYILMNDIDMTEDTAPGGKWDINGTGWQPIGDESHLFRGVFDGNGHSIIGMNIHGDPDYFYIGLFGYINTGSVSRLGMKNVNINLSLKKRPYYGGVSCGSIVGDVYFGSISNCFAEGNISVTDELIADRPYLCVGGIIGYASEGGISYFRDCYNAVNISGDGLQGGIGVLKGDPDYYKANNSFIAQGCYNIGKLRGSAISPFEENIIDCYYLEGSCNNQQSTSGICQSLSESSMKTKTSFENWDFENTWIIVSNTNYKYPQLRSCMQVSVADLTITSLPKKTFYISGNKIDLTGGKIMVRFEDKSYRELNITENMLGKYDMSKVGNQSISVNYLNKSTSFDITVNEKVLGDANSDGKLSIRDAAYIAIMLAKKMGSDLPEYADFNKDNEVNIRDAAAIAIYHAKIKK